MKISGSYRVAPAAPTMDAPKTLARPPAFSYTGGAVGYLRIRGEKNPPLTLALLRHSPDFAIRHELLHVVREAEYRVRHGESLFEAERECGFFGGFWLMLREESIVWWRTFRTASILHPALPESSSS